jgi:ADP-L-glycero-D-manno-heptose 6-epimerase
MRVLVTGAAGFIGSNLALGLEAAGHEVIAADNLSSGNSDNLAGFSGRFIKAEISQGLTVDGRLDAIFHQAAITDPRYEDQGETIRMNIGGFKTALELAEQKNAKLIYASTASLYGNTAAPQREDQEKEILSAYAQSKLIIDEMACHHFNEMHIVGLRYFNVFGPNEQHKGRPASMVCHLTKTLKEGKTPRLFKWGEQKRDHIYVKDCVRANLLALEAPSGIYNVGTGIATSFLDLLNLVQAELGTDFKPEYVDNPYGRTYQLNTQADTTRAEKILKFKAQYPLKKAIHEYVKTL